MLLGGQTSNLTPTLPLPGQQLGEFIIESEVGRCGAAWVYVGWQRRLDRKVTLKILAPDESTSVAEIERFHASARAASRLRHPGFVPVLTNGEIDGIHYCALELVDGETLAHEVNRLKTAPWTQGILPSLEDDEYLPTVLRLVHDLAKYLSHAHAESALHKNLEPSNILLDSHGRPRLSECGLDYPRSGQASRYRAPDVTGTAAGVGRLADLYSLGAILDELTSLPDGSKRHEDTPAEVIDLIERSLSHKPEERPASATEFAAILAERAAKPKRTGVWNRLSNLVRGVTN